LLYVPTKFGPSDVTPLTRLVLVTRSGRATTLAENAGMTWYPRFSPDGARLAYALSAGRNQLDAADLWVLDITRGARTRVTFKGNNRFFPIWTRDGMRLTFAESSGPSNRIVWALADGSGAPEMLLEEPTRAFPNSWSPDGRTLAYHLGGNGTNATQRDIWMLHLAGGTWTKKPFVQTPFEEAGAAFSPDGHWVAYVSRKAGRNDVYARPFPGPGPEVTISVDGGQEPVWGPSGRELFYRHEGRLLVAKIAEASDRLTAGSPSPVFDDRFVPDFTGINAMANYDISPEGRRFVMVDEPAAPKAPLEAVRFQVVLNWTDELKRRVPTK
jgi:Tol biopolymer transport system component